MNFISSGEEDFDVKLIMTKGSEEDFLAWLQEKGYLMGWSSTNHLVAEPEGTQSETGARFTVGVAGDANIWAHVVDADLNYVSENLRANTGMTIFEGDAVTLSTDGPATVLEGQNITVYCEYLPLLNAYLHLTPDVTLIPGTGTAEIVSVSDTFFVIKGLTSGTVTAQFLMIDARDPLDPKSTFVHDQIEITVYLN